MMKVNLNVVNPKPLSIVFLLSGESFPADFFDSFVDLVGYCYSNNIKFIINRQYSPVVYFVRNLCLAGDVKRGEDQKPFNGTLDYTHMMWIDNDIAFKPNQFQALLDSNKDIVSGVYKMKDGKHYATVKNWDEEYFKENGTFKFLTDGDFKENTELMDVDYTGLGFMLVKRGVFESLKYPWFKPIFYKMGNCVDFCSEDVGFCRSIKEKGYKIYIDPKIRVGHIKEIIL